MSKKGKPKQLTPVFDTLAVTDAKRKTGDAAVTIPRDESVEAAKMWVDENEK